MGNLKAIATKEGLVVVMNKHELVHLKNGGVSNLTLISGGQKVHITFMRDTTFKAQRRQLQVLADKTAEHEQELKADIEGIANDLV